MPKIEISYDDLCGLVGKKIKHDELEDALLLAKSELDEQSGDTLKIDIKDTNRPDLWSTEGVAREIRMRYKKSYPNYRARKSHYVVRVENKSGVQFRSAACVAKNLKMTTAVLSQIIQIQEKLSVAFGRNRRDISMGVYDLERIKFPLRYTAMPPEKIKFTPLGFEKELNGRQILEMHQKGREFGHLIEKESRFPVWIDASGKILSMPPIINSSDAGNVGLKTRNVFIECTGYNDKMLGTAINILAAQMLERGADVYEVRTLYSKGSVVSPQFDGKKFSVDVDYINKIAGMSLDKKTIINILQRSGYRTKAAGRKVSLIYPSYRQDIMHPRDVVEDVLITYGYNAIEPLVDRMSTTGRVSAESEFSEKVSEIMIGMGLQEIMSYTLSNYSDLFTKMCTPRSPAVEIENPVSSTWSVFRTWLLPGVMDFLSKNKHVEYPHKIFEIGKCIVPDETMETMTRDENKIAAAITNSVVSYEDMSSILDALMRNLGIKYSLRKHDHPSFINGRCAEVVSENTVGLLGEIHPQVLNNWKLDKPAVALELDMDKLMALKEKELHE